MTINIKHECLCKNITVDIEQECLDCKILALDIKHKQLDVKFTYLIFCHIWPSIHKWGARKGSIRDFGKLVVGETNCWQNDQNLNKSHTSSAPILSSQWLCCLKLNPVPISCLFNDEFQFQSMELYCPF